MQQTSALYKEIVRSQNFYVETSLILCDNTIDLELDDPDYGYRENVLRKIGTHRQVFPNDTPTIGGAVCGTVDVEMLKPSEFIPKMARITIYARVVSRADESVKSEWLRKGVFFIDTRDCTKNDDGLDVFTCSGYDAMLKADADYPGTEEGWGEHKTDLNVVQEIASYIGVEVDPRTIAKINQGYQILPPFAYSMRETLGFIAGMYCGNFIINDLGMLHLIGLDELPPETFYLTDEGGDPITFGGDRIIWSE